MTIGQRIQELMIAAGYNQMSLARACGLGETAIRDLIKGQKAEPKPSSLYKIAEVLGVTMETILGKPELESSQKREPGKDSDSTSENTVNGLFTQNDPLQKIRITHNVALLGIVEAGAWREMNEDGNVLGHIGIDDPDLIGIKQFGYVVSGTSMNKVFPEGVSLICVRPHDIPLRNGQYVILRRTQGDIAETTCKQFEVGSDGTWRFWPRSTDPKYQEPLVAPPRNEMQQEGWEILAIVRRWVPTPFEYRGEIIDFEPADTVG